jgi:hypothetical protein
LKLEESGERIVSMMSTCEIPHSVGDRAVCPLFNKLPGKTFYAEKQTWNARCLAFLYTFQKSGRRPARRTLISMCYNTAENMKAQALFVVCLLFTNLMHGQEPALRISVVAGEGASQVINQKGRVDPVVQVQDANGKAIEGAEVAFTLPNQGPSGVFENGSKTLTVTTDAEGRATGRGLVLNRLKGDFDIQVTASYQGRTASVSVAQKSVARIHSAGAFGISTKTWVIAGLCLLAIAGGIIAAKELRSGSKPNVLTATPGIPTVGGPQ